MDFSKAFEYENNYYWTCDNSRISKTLVHYELYKRIVNLPGAIVECGVFKGTSFITLATIRNLLESAESRKMVGFDVFGKFPETEYMDDKTKRQNFINAAGECGLSLETLVSVLDRKLLNKNIEFVVGNILHTVPQYMNDNPEFRVSLLNLDTDVYEPAKIILECFWPRMVYGGIIMVDDYGIFPGETRAVDDFLAVHDLRIIKSPLRETPCIIMKN